MEESTGSSSLRSWIPRPSSVKHLWSRGKLLLLLLAHISPWCCCPIGSAAAWTPKLLPPVFSRAAAGLTQDSLSSSQCGQQHQDLGLVEEAIWKTLARAPSGSKCTGLHRWLLGTTFPSLIRTSVERRSQFSVTPSRIVSPQV